MIYQFPETNRFKAREVLDADFDIREFEEANLYVDLDSVRITSRFNNYRSKIKESLKIGTQTNSLEAVTGDYKKILFSGYKGSGKTMELYKLHNEINDPNRYFSIFIELEKESEIETFQFEDYFILLIFKLASEIEAREISISTVELDAIMNEWLSDTEIVKEVKVQAKIETGAEVSTGFDLLGYFKTKFSIKTSLAASNSVAKKMRQQVKDNALPFIHRFNLALGELRAEINRVEQGKDILFIVDGFEKTEKLGIYDQLFVTDSHIIRQVDANIVTAVPIHVHFKAEFHFADSLFDATFLVPVIKINEESIIDLGKIISKRISKDHFFENDEVLDYFAEMSGGIVRQLLKIVNFALLYMEGEKISLAEAKESTMEYARRMFDRLKAEEKQVLKDVKQNNRSIEPANEMEGKLVFNLFLLKYNGSYAINPLLNSLF